jgi:hypothetical protein
MRTRMSGGVGGGSREVSPYPDFRERDAAIGFPLDLLPDIHDM